MDQHDKANTCFLQFFNLPKNHHWTALITSISANHSTTMLSDCFNNHPKFIQAHCAIYRLCMESAKINAFIWDIKFHIAIIIIIIIQLTWYWATC
jgi:hypothetical protein